MTDIIRDIRKIVLASLNAQKLTDIVYGTVESIAPLKIRVDQKLLLEQEKLKLTSTVHNVLINGDKVTMIRAHGGQQYLVIDKEVV